MPGINSFSWKCWQVFHCNDATRHRAQLQHQTYPNQKAKQSSGATKLLEKSLSWLGSDKGGGGRARIQLGATAKPICQGQPQLFGFSAVTTTQSDRISLPRHCLIILEVIISFPSFHNRYEASSISKQMEKGDSEGKAMVWDPEIILLSF